MDLAPNIKPKARIYIEENWDQFKDKSILTIKKEIKDICDLGCEQDIRELGFWFNNHKQKLKKINTSKI